ncbi:Protein RESTRICTED TEV MOVEMENT like [Actinidia chinensis var. chinensis]|uniref:Protein RESTRICTED TEV MOVEMENT like n=1 Tax=Actinidia chinensis var. chinensis TaxID=1590841 RepID=A0A2R6Q463_ACTCC|nr:Protein RESTRICTED TEV MOVEMENT like [Actinidia chinensis var. chinensis]
MESKKNGGDDATQSYEDFEPFCNWIHDEKYETLVLHLPAFKKEQLKVKIINLRTLKIFGERPLDATKRSRFYKETAIPKDCNVKEIHAKFVGGLLHIVMPKKVSLAPQQEQPEGAEKLTIPKNINSQDHQVDKLPTLPKIGSAMETIEDSRLRRLVHVTTNVAVVVAVVACLGAYIIYSYRSLYAEAG